MKILIQKSIQPCNLVVSLQDKNKNDLLLLPIF